MGDQLGREPFHQPGTCPAVCIAPRPLTTDEIGGATLEMARSNVSTSLRELLSWQLIRRVGARRSARSFRERKPDQWAMVNRIAAGRKARGSIQSLQRCANALRQPRVTRAVDADATGAWRRCSSS